jgi:hypothetical protein
MVWLLATRTAKLLPHLWHRPQDVIYVPAFILFGYYFAIMKLYALCTLHEVCSLTVELYSTVSLPSVLRLVGELALESAIPPLPRTQRRMHRTKSFKTHHGIKTSPSPTHPFTNSKLDTILSPISNSCNHGLARTVKMNPMSVSPLAGQPGTTSLHSKCRLGTRDSQWGTGGCRQTSFLVLFHPWPLSSLFAYIPST